MMTHISIVLDDSVQVWTLIICIYQLFRRVEPIVALGVWLVGF